MNGGHISFLLQSVSTYSPAKIDPQSETMPKCCGSFLKSKRSCGQMVTSIAHVGQQGNADSVANM